MESQPGNRSALEWILDQYKEKKPGDPRIAEKFNFKTNLIMKHLTVFSIALLLSFTSFCQNTTEEEYNYMKKGYKQSLENGLDLKKGYKVEKLKTYKDGSVTVTFTLFKRDNGTLAGTILKTENNDAFGSGVNYYVIPSASVKGPESFGWKEFFSDLETMTNGMKGHVIKYMSYFYSALIAESKLK